MKRYHQVKHLSHHLLSLSSTTTTTTTGVSVAILTSSYSFNMQAYMIAIQYESVVA